MKVSSVAFCALLPLGPPPPPPSARTVAQCADSFPDPALVARIRGAWSFCTFHGLALQELDHPEVAGVGRTGMDTKRDRLNNSVGLEPQEGGDWPQGVRCWGLVLCFSRLASTSPPQSPAPRRASSCHSSGGLRKNGVKGALQTLGPSSRQVSWLLGLQLLQLGLP